MKFYRIISYIAYEINLSSPITRIKNPNECNNLQSLGFKYIIYVLLKAVDYIIPPMPPIGGIAGAAAFSSTLSATIVSVVNTREAMDAAF